MAVALGVAVGVALLAHSGHAQGVGDGPTAVVTTGSSENGWENVVSTGIGGGAAVAIISRFLTVLERVVTDTRGAFDRWMDKNNGKIIVKFEHKKTIVNTWAEDDPDRTGPIQTHNRRRTDPRDRNGTAESNGEDDYHG